VRLYTKRLEPQLLFGLGAQGSPDPVGFSSVTGSSGSPQLFSGRGYRAGIDVREQRKNNRRWSDGALAQVAQVAEGAVEAVEDSSVIFEHAFYIPYACFIREQGTV